MVLSGDTLKIRFQNLQIADGSPSGIEAIVHINLPAGEDEAIFTIELNNRGMQVICEVLFPWVGGWYGFPGERGVIWVGTHAPLNPFTDLRRNDGWNLLNGTRRVNIGFPHVNIPMCDVTNDTVGLAYNFYPAAHDLNFDLFVMDLNDLIGDVYPSFSWVHRPFVQPGKSWKSGAVGMTPHQGGWHAAADKMRRWLAGWWRVPVLPASLLGAIGFHNAYFRDFSGREMRPLSSMPELARYGLEHGIKHLVVWDMPLLGMYLRAGKGNLLEDSPERTAELRQVLAEVRRMGVCVSPLTNMRLGTQDHPFWKKHGEKWAIRSRYGMPAQETLPLRRNTAMLINRYLDQGGIKFCQGFPEFQEWALANTQKILDLGFNAIFIDQPFSEDYCFSDQHGHPVPTAGHEGTLKWIPRAADIVHKSGPDSYVIGEVPDIWNTQYFDLWWFWDWTWLKPEVFRYILPESMQSWVIDTYDHLDQVGKAFSMGFLLNINVRSLEKTILDAPQFTDQVAQLATLRRKTASFTLEGHFIDRTGLTIDTDAEVAAGVYDAGSRTGIIIGEGSPGAGGGGKVKLILEPAALQAKAVTQVIRHGQDGATQLLKIARSGESLVIETQLDRWESAVLEVVKA